MSDTDRRIDRRKVLIGAATVSILGLDVIAAEVTREIKDLKPGEFTWTPDKQPTGPVAIVVSIPEQRVHVYRNGVRIAVSTCSTGKPGHSTPTGVFVILEKDKNHKSSTYDDAPMPNMNRLTWSGIALHAGKLPGYPASHGCVRLPLDFSAKLFTVTHLGTPVIIAGSHTDPWELTHPGMVLSGYAEHEFQKIEATLTDKKHPADWIEPAPVVSVVASSTDKKIILLENGNVIAESALAIAGDGPFGGHVLVLQGPHGDSKGMKWSAISHEAETGNSQANDQLLQRLKADADFMARISERMHPGMIVILTDAPLHPDTRSGKDFVIMS